MINFASHTRLLKKWADLATCATRVPSGHLGWSSARHLVRSATPYFGSQNESLQRALTHSRKRFGLPDPLEVDFGLHKWLRGDREEAYSAWLGWIIEQFDDTDSLLAIFGIRDSQVVAGPICARTEEWTGKGHEGKLGRVDIAVTINGRPILLLEVKMGSADSADTIKQTGYVKSRRKFKHKVLLAESGEKDTYPGCFKLHTWKNTCIELRRWLPHGTRSKRIHGAMVLAFVGAVEQNIIGYPGRLDERIKERTLVGSDVSDHIQAGNTRRQG